jgi:exosortase/archaeosortase family protein
MSNKSLIRFLVLCVVLYIGWYLVYELWLHPGEYIDKIVINNTIQINEFLLELFNYKVFTQGRTIGIKPTEGLWIGDPCNGLNLFALFAGFIIAYPGKKKLLFITFGIISIHLLNSLRVTALLLIFLYSPESLDFNHTYTFTIIIYAYIFTLWVYWVNKYGASAKKENLKSKNGD